MSLSFSKINSNPDFENLTKVYPLNKSFKYRVFIKDEGNWYELNFETLLKDTIKINPEILDNIYIFSKEEINNRYIVSNKYIDDNIYNPELICKLLYFSKSKLEEVDDNILKRHVYYLAKIYNICQKRNIEFNYDKVSNSKNMNINNYFKDIEYIKHSFAILDLFDILDQYDSEKIEAFPEDKYKSQLQKWIHKEVLNLLKNDINSLEFIDRESYINDWDKLSKKMLFWSNVFNEMKIEYSDSIFTKLMNYYGF